MHVRLERNFSVVAPAGRVWRYLMDVDAIARCVPGADLRALDGEKAYEGTVTIGGIALRGTLRAIDADEDERLSSFAVEAREAGGVAIGAGTVRGRVGPAKGATLVALSADLKLTGVRVTAEVVEHVGTEFLEGFARQLERRVLNDQGEAHASSKRAHTDETRMQPAGAADVAPRLGTSPQAPDRKLTAAAGSVAAVLLGLMAARALRRSRRKLSVVIRL